MEIRLEKLTYQQDADTNRTKNLLNKIDYTFNSGKITAIINNQEDVLGAMFTAMLKPTGGAFYLGETKIDRKTHLREVEILRKDIAYVYRQPKTFSNNTVYQEIAETIKNFGLKADIEKKAKDALKLVGLEEEMLSIDPNKLCYSHQKKLQLAIALCHNPKVIILDHFEKGFNYRDKDIIKKLLKKLKIKSNKTILLITNDVSFLLDLVDNVIVINNGNLDYIGTKNDFYDDKLYRYIAMPKIIRFIKTCQEQGHNILPYIDIKELLKAVYRDVK